MYICQTNEYFCSNSGVVWAGLFHSWLFLSVSQAIHLFLNYVYSYIRSVNNLPMSPAAIQEQVNIIKLATEKALQSKEAALKILVSAGIVELDKDRNNQAKEFVPSIK